MLYNVFRSLALALLATSPFGAAQALAAPPSDAQAQVSQPNYAWHHLPTHPIHALFRRDASHSFHPVGSAEWRSSYPSNISDTSTTPKAWLDALAAAVSAGKVPNIPASSIATGSPVYPPGTMAGSKSVCSSSYQCRGKYDVWDGPAGTFAVAFDDGPLPPSDALYTFLQANKQAATHFMIGVNILANPDRFTQAFKNGDDLAVHTWSHPYTTSLTNERIVAELGWTMQLIHDSSEGRVPRFWRPPYGDSDERVRAIAKEVFGLSTIIWNHDTNDWQIGMPNGTTPSKIATQMDTWINGSKTPGLVVLEHVLSQEAVQTFMDAYPKLKEKGWNTVSAARLLDGYDGNTGQTYWNAPPGAGGAISKDMNILEGSKTSVNSISPGVQQGAGSGRSGTNSPPAINGPGKAASKANDSGAKAARRSISITAPATLPGIIAIFWAWQRWL